MFIGRICKVRINPIVLDQLSHGKAKEILEWLQYHRDYGDDYFPIERDAEYGPQWFISDVKDGLIRKARQEFFSQFANDIACYGKEIFMLSIVYVEVKDGFFRMYDSREQRINDVRLAPVGGNE